MSESDELHNEQQDTDSDLILTGDFDIQVSIIKKKKKAPVKFYIKFDLFTGKILEISPLKIVNSNIRHGLIESEFNELINSLLTAKIPYSKSHVTFNEDKKEFELQVINRHKKSNSHLIFAKHDEISPICINIDTILKSIHVVFDDKQYKIYISKVASDENSFYRNRYIDFYFSKNGDMTKLVDKITCDFDDLIKLGKISFRADWIADIKETVTVMHSPNLGFTASVSYNQIDKEPRNTSVMKPQILYKQTDSMISLQSIMENTDNYKINNKINLFIHKSNDPSILLGKIQIDKEKFNNFGSVNLIMNYKEKVKISTDHSYIYIEDNDVSTYYKF